MLVAISVGAVLLAFLLLHFVCCVFNLKRLFLTSVYKELFSCNTSTKNGVINGEGGVRGVGLEIHTSVNLMYKSSYSTITITITMYNNREIVSR